MGTHYNAAVRRVVLIAKRPRRGRVKTRLARSLGADAALALYRALLEDTLRGLEPLARDGCEVELCYDGPAGDEDPRPDYPCRLTTQGPGDLGDRLRDAAARAFAAGVSRVVLIGADAPTLDAERIGRAFDALSEGADAVIAPAADGGYLMLGLAALHRPLLAGMPWSEPGLADATRAAATAASLRLAELAAGYDVDDLASLSRLRAELAAGAVRAPATRRALARLDDRQGPVV